MSTESLINQQKKQTKYSIGDIVLYKSIKGDIYTVLVVDARNIENEDRYLLCSPNGKLKVNCLNDGIIKLLKSFKHQTKLDL